MPSALDKLIQTFFKMEELDKAGKIPHEYVEEVFKYLAEKKCCLYCSKYYQCEHANKTEDGRCASYEACDEIKENGIRSFLEKRNELLKNLIHEFTFIKCSLYS